MTEIRAVRYWVGVAFGVIALIVSFFIPGPYNENGVFLALLSPAIANLLWFETAPCKIFISMVKFSPIPFSIGSSLGQSGGIAALIGLVFMGFGIVFFVLCVAVSVIFFALTSLFCIIPQLIIGFFSAHR